MNIEKCKNNRPRDRIDYLMLCVMIALYITITAKCCGQTLLVPAYDPASARKALATHGNAPICLVINPNDGPGTKLDGAYASLFRAVDGNAAAVAYIDLKRWKSGKGSWKKPEDLRKEKSAYQNLYAHTGGWFFDDADRVPPSLLFEISQWPGERILNPGYPTPVMYGFVSIMHESGGWLAAACPAAPDRQGAMALNLKPKDLAAAWAKAKGLRYFYAHELADDWQSGKTAYNRLPVYWPQLVFLAATP